MTIIQPALTVSGDRRRSWGRPASSASGRRIARFLRANRQVLSRLILGCVADMAKYSRWSEGESVDPDRVGLEEFSVVVDCLAHFFEQSDERYFDIVVGEMLKITHLPELSSDEQVACRDRISLAIKEGLQEHGAGVWVLGRWRSSRPSSPDCT